MKRLFTLIVVALATIYSSEANADILMFDDFQSGSVSTTTDGFRMREYSIDDGWQAARQGGGSDWTIVSGRLENASTINTNGYPNYIPGEAPVAQAVSTNGLTGGASHDEIKVSFDYSVSAGDILYVTFWGHTGTYDSGSSNIYANLEARYGLSNNEGSSTLDTFNLLDGATNGFGGTTNAFASFDGGLAGTSGTFEATVDVAALGIGGVSTVGDFTAFTFGLGKMEDGNAGTSFIDNLSITTAIPEPTSLALLGLTLALVSVRRKR